MDKLINSVVIGLHATYNPKVIILHGSYGRGEHTETSDIDIVCFCDDIPNHRYSYMSQDKYVDVHLFPVSFLDNLHDESFYFDDGIVVYDTNNMGRDYLVKIQQFIATNNQNISTSEKHHIGMWVTKMLDRSQVDGVHGAYRRIWLQRELLKIYFEMRDLWYFGPKRALIYLDQNDQRVYKMFDEAYRDPSNLNTLTTLANEVIKPLDNLS